jgi:hypothetical protein
MKIYDGRTSFYQWDINQKITAPWLKVGDEFHITNLRQSTTPVLKAYELNGVVVVDIPNILLQQSYPIFVYRYIETDDMAFTSNKFVFDVKQRQKPDDYVYTETEMLNYKALENRISYLEQFGTGGGSTARIGYVTLLSDAWQGEENLYSQIVAIDGVSENTQVDLTPSAEQLGVFYNKDLTFVTENKNGVVTVYAIGQKPQNDYTIQVTMTEVYK